MTHLDGSTRTGVWGSGPGYCRNLRCRQSLVGLDRNRNALTCSDACRQAVFRDNRDARERVGLAIPIRAGAS